ncbi:MAG: metal-dependent transcriptional regulator [Clostridia bacterium]|nr:metal-dependent transcriptional regulator [Clostridia bacterium]
MKIQESGEMYLETILILSREQAHVRSIDIGEHMGFSKPSVSRAVGLLKQGGYITVDNDGYITLTELGKEIAEKIYGRHNMLTRFLTSLGVSDEVASSDACKIEHTLSDETVSAIERYINNLEK